MNADILYATDFPHGTPDGFARGCHGSHCPAPMACRDVRRRYVGDFGFARQFDAGVPLDVILEREREAAREARRAERDALRVKRPRRKNRPAERRVAVGANTDLQRQVAELHAQGLTDREIGDRLDRTADTIRSVRRWMGLVITRETPKRTLVGDLHGQGMTDTQIGAELGISREYAANVRRELGLKPHPEPRSKIPTVDILRLHGEGLTDQQIADALGCDPGVVKKRRNNHRIKANKPPAMSGVSSREAA